MTDRGKDGPESMRLKEDVARRLIKRATELDASLSTESSVAELREAAREAGISEEAFQRALDEVRAHPVEAPSPRPEQGFFARRKFLVVALVLLGMGMALMLVRLVAPVPPGLEAVPAAPVVEIAIPAPGTPVPAPSSGPVPMPTDVRPIPPPAQPPATRPPSR